MEEKKFTESEIVLENVSGEPITPRRKRGFELSNKDSAFKVIIAIATVFLTIFGIWEGFRAGFTVTALLMFLCLTVYFANRNTKIRIFSVLCGFLNCALASTFAITSNGLIRFMGLISMTVLSAIWFMYLVKVPTAHTDFGIVSNIAVPFFKSFTVSLPSTIAAFFRSNSNKRGSMGKIMLGVLCSLPVLVVVVPLLMSSDAAFAGLISKILGESFFTFFKIVVGLVLSVFILSYCFTLKKRELPNRAGEDINFIDSTIATSFLAVLSFCYLGYLFAQLAYFFSAFKGILPEDYEFTLSNYARRGFFEMCIIAVINFVIIYVVLMLAKKNKGKICVSGRLLCGFMGLFTLLIISTALSKMILYIGEYGMTKLRIYTSMFMLFLGLVFIALILRTFFLKVPVLKVAIITAATVIALMGVVNVNSVIASYNYNGYINGDLKEMDVNTIYRLGDEGVVYLVKLTNCEDTEVAENAENKLDRIIKNGKYYELEIDEQVEDNFDDDKYVIKEKKYDALGEYSIARDEAYRALDKYVEKNPDVLYVY